MYPVAVQLVDNFYGDLLASAQTLLPFWPGQQTANLLHPLKIAWVWPLIDQPHHQVCTAATNNAAATNSGALTNGTALTNNDLAASLSSGGRLSALLAAGISHPDADLTWVVDPALLGDAATMTRPYQVDPQPDCTGGQTEPASKAAASWLSSLKTATSAQPTVITPYANVDMTALVHQGLNADLTSAYSLGEAVARNVLGQVFRPEIAWPAGGSADLSVLTDLAATEGVSTVVLNSGEMPPAHRGFVPDDAATSIRTGAGQTMNVLLADNALTGVLSVRGQQLRRPVAGHRVRRRAAFPRRDRDDRRRGPLLVPLGRGGPAAGLEPVAGAGRRPARRDRKCAVAEAGHAGQPDHGAGHAADGVAPAAAGPARRARENSAMAT